MARRKASATQRRVLTLTDPRSLRALAHPARQLLIAELTGGRVLTATEAAELVGLSPSAVSHHLRALEKYGIAERADAEPGRDGRTRPWRSAYDDLTFSPVGADSSATVTLMRDHLRSLDTNFTAAIARGTTPGDERQFGFSVAETWLTDAERDDLLHRLDEALSQMPHRHSGDHPEGSTHLQVTIAHVPLS